MDYEQLKHTLQTSAPLKLFRSLNAPLILSFLSQQFKVTHRVTITQAELETNLSDYLEFVRELEPESYPRPAKEYLNQWCEEQFLRKTFDQQDEPTFTLTAATEKAIAWLEDLSQPDEFIGTESRFLQIFDLLKELQERSTTDVESRIQQLERDRDRIQQEIDEIRTSGIVPQFSSTQLQERFLLANRVTRQLIADFKDIENNFRELTRKVQTAQFAKDHRKGAIVGRVLDVDQELHESDQGRSFYAFWQFLMSEQKRQELKAMIQIVYQLESLQSLTPEYPLLRRIERHLLAAGEYIVQSNARLAEKLRQMLDERNLQENRRVAELMNEVQGLALQIAPQAPPDLDFWTMTTKPNVQLAFTRPLHPLEVTEGVKFDLNFTQLNEVDLTQEITELYTQFYVDEATLMQNITQSLEQISSITLPDLLQLYPITQGLPEIVTYVAIATQNDQHRIDRSIIDFIVIPSLEPMTQLQLRLPRIIFRR